MPLLVPRMRSGLSSRPPVTLSRSSANAGRAQYRTEKAAWSVRCGQVSSISMNHVNLQSSSGNKEAHAVRIHSSSLREAFAAFYVSVSDSFLTERLSMKPLLPIPNLVKRGLALVAGRYHVLSLNIAKAFQTSQRL